MEPYSPIPPHMRPAQPLPNSSTVLVLGIIASASLFVCFCIPVPLILAIIALVMGSRDRKLYRANPGLYSGSSNDDLTLGIILSIVSLVVFFAITAILMALYAVEILKELGSI